MIEIPYGEMLPFPLEFYELMSYEMEADAGKKVFRIFTRV
jgi:hypothetical protein